MISAYTHIIDTLNGDIAATDMTVDPTYCSEPCNVTVTVTWQNISNKTQTFRPTILINGTRIRKEEITLAKNETTTQTFNLTDLIEGTYEICPHPN